jgi:hypothetical protein
MRTVPLAWLAIATSAGLRAAHACSPCDDRLSLTATARRADLVVVAVRVGDEQALDGGQHSVTYAPFDVREPLKGTPSASRIMVATQYGMCSYGVDVEAMVPSLLFLEAHDDQYEPVRGGCAVKSLPIVSGKVVLADLPVPLATVASELGLMKESPERESPRSRRFEIAILCCAASTGLAIGFWLGRRRSR